MVNPAPNAVVSMGELYAEAVALSAKACLQAQKAAEDEDRELVRKTTQAQDALFGKVLAAAPDAIRAAASQGARAASVLEFQGADMFESAGDQFSYLFLLKGPKESPRRRDLTAFGFEPLLLKLRRVLAPFRVNHVWDQATNSNCVHVAW